MSDLVDVRVSRQEIRDLADGARKLLPVLKMLDPGAKSELMAWLLLVTIICQRANES